MNDCTVCAVFYNANILYLLSVYALTCFHCKCRQTYYDVSNLL